MTAARHAQFMGRYDECNAVLQLLSSTACMGGVAGMIKQKSLHCLFVCLLIQSFHSLVFAHLSVHASIKHLSFYQDPYIQSQADPYEKNCLRCKAGAREVWISMQQESRSDCSCLMKMCANRTAALQHSRAIPLQS